MVKIPFQKFKLWVGNGIALLIVEHSANLLQDNIVGCQQISFIGNIIKIILTMGSYIIADTETPV